MKFHVNSDCIGCGLCVSTCPEVFSMTDAGTAAAVPGDVDGLDESAAKEAMQSCPVSAIEAVSE
ncbi:MAG: ferredoxin [Oscillospiraceae bacterium]|nr:ferredoxin [Oscillospiraceae bacterium]